MFTGIIEKLGAVEQVETNGNNRVLWIHSPISVELKVDQSVNHNGVCLTIDQVKTGAHRVTVIEETLLKTTIGSWVAGNLVNMERSVRINDRLDGHIVQGHVDTVANCINMHDKNGSREYSFEVDREYAPLIIEKGSIAVNGISLTIFNVTKNTFDIGIIPYTYNNTNFLHLKPDDKVNIEFDMIGKYLARFAALKKKS